MSAAASAALASPSPSLPAQLGSRASVRERLPGVMRQLLAENGPGLVVEHDGRRWVKRSAVVALLADGMWDPAAQDTSLAALKKCLTAVLDGMQRAKRVEIVGMKVAGSVYVTLQRPAKPPAAAPKPL